MKTRQAALSSTRFSQINPWKESSNVTSLAIVALIALLLGCTPGSQAQTLTVLHSFNGSDGQSPRTALVRDSSGNLYGTAFYGGIYQNCDNEVGGGTIFKVDIDGNTSVLHAFNNDKDGCFPDSLLLDSAGNLYGDDGSNIFTLTGSGALSVFHNFRGFRQGAQPTGPLFRDPEGNLYGTTFTGGSSKCGLGTGCGAVFKIDSTGRETVLYSFTGGADGGNPVAGVIRDAAGNLYGTAAFGGIRAGVCALPHDSVHGCGTVFKLAADGTFTVLHTFAGGADGRNPASGLLLDSAGNLFGIMTGGGNLDCDAPFGCGAVYKIASDGTKTAFYAFQSRSDGYYPSGTLVQDVAGNFYGATERGGNSGDNGVIYKLDKNGTETVLHRFNGKDGAGPSGGVIVDDQGSLYGTTTFGGTDGAGTVFKLVPQELAGTGARPRASDTHP